MSARGDVMVRMACEAHGAVGDGPAPMAIKPDRRAAGQRVEQRVQDWLVGRGLQPVAANVHFKVGELDLVMRDGEVLVFVEVRSRLSRATGSRYGQAVETISWAKQRRVLAAAQLFLATRYRNRPPVSRIDVVTVDAGRLRWIRDAIQLV